MTRATCLECEAMFEAGPKQPRIGTLFSCPECGTEHEVIAENPLMIVYLPREPIEEWPDEPETGP